MADPAIEEGREPIRWLVLAMLAVLSIPLVASMLTSGGSPNRSSAPPGDEKWGSRVGRTIEDAVGTDDIWEASAGVWHLEGGSWLRNGTVPEEGLALSPDGTMWLHTTAEVLSDKVEESGLEAEIRKVLIHDDGRVWACGEGLLLHYNGAEWSLLPMPTELGVLGCELAVTSEGTVWVGTFNAWDPTVGNLASFDGEGWEFADPFGDGTRLPVVALSVGPDGGLWAVFVEFEAANEFAEFKRWAMATFDGEQWTAYTEDIPDRFPVSAVTTFEGAVWLDLAGGKAERGLITFDGNRWRKYVDGRTPPSNGGAGRGTVWLAGPERLLSLVPGTDGGS